MPPTKSTALLLPLLLLPSVLNELLLFGLETYQRFILIDFINKLRSIFISTLFQYRVAFSVNFVADRHTHTHRSNKQLRIDTRILTQCGGIFLISHIFLVESGENCKRTFCGHINNISNNKQQQEQQQKATGNKPISFGNAATTFGRM